jgi:hypothetical protein
MPTDSFRAQAEAESPALIPVLNAYPHGQTNLTQNVAQFAEEGQCSPTFGQILNTVNTGPVGTGTLRQLQFMLRLNF